MTRRVSSLASNNESDVFPTEGDENTATEASWLSSPKGIITSTQVPGPATMPCGPLESDHLPWWLSTSPIFSDPQAESNESGLKPAQGCVIMSMCYPQLTTINGSC